MTTAVSVVIAARNAEATIGEQLQALCEQPWPGDGEVIVVDNGSTDETAAVASSFDSAAVPVRVIDARERPGAGYARNRGVAASSFAKIAFCDADDVVSPTWVEAISEGLDESVAVGGRLDFERLNDPWTVGSRGRLLARGQLPLFDGAFPVLSSCNLGIRRVVFDELGGFDVDYLRGQDAELSLRLHRAGHDPSFLDEAVVHYRMRTSLRDIYAQAKGWGEVQVALRFALGEGFALGAERRSRFRATARSWLWLGARLPLLVSRSGRARWAYVAGIRVGARTASRQKNGVASGRLTL